MGVRCLTTSLGIGCVFMGAATLQLSPSIHACTPILSMRLELANRHSPLIIALQLYFHVSHIPLALAHSSLRCLGLPASPLDLLLNGRCPRLTPHTCTCVAYSCPPIKVFVLSRVQGTHSAAMTLLLQINASRLHAEMRSQETVVVLE